MWKDGTVKTKAEMVRAFGTVNNMGASFSWAHWDDTSKYEFNSSNTEWTKVENTTPTEESLYLVAMITSDKDRYFSKFDTLEEAQKYLENWTSANTGHFYITKVITEVELTVTTKTKHYT